MPEDYSQFFQNLKKKAPARAAPIAPKTTVGSSGDFSQFFNKSDAQATPGVTPPGQMPSDIGKPAPTPGDTSTNPISKFFGGVKNAVGQEIGLLKKDPKGELGNLFDIIKKGAVTGGKEMAGAIAWGSEKNLENDPIKGMLIPGVAKEVQRDQVAKKIYAGAAAQETKDTSKLNSAQKFIYGMAQFIPAMLLPVGGEEDAATAATKTVMQKMMSAGADNAIQAAFLYNPEKHPGAPQLKEFLNQAATNFVFGAAMHGASDVAGKAVDYMVMKPMAKAAEVVTDKINDYVTDDVMTRLTPSILGSFNEQTVNITGKDLVDILKGQKTTFDTSFFSSPDWKDVVKQYGVNSDDYPDRMFAPRPNPMPVIEGLRVPKLPSADLSDVLDLHVREAAGALARGDMDGYSGNLAVMNEAAGELEKRGYNVDRDTIMEGVNDYAGFQRQYEEFNIDVEDQESKKAMVSSLDDTGLLKPLQKVRQLYNLLQGQPGYTDQKVADAYMKWAGDNNLGGFDELGEGLRNAGYKIPENDPTELVKFANALPTGADITRKITAPAPIDPTKIVSDSVKYPENVAVDKPFFLTPKEMEAATKARPSTGDVQQAMLENSPIHTVTSPDGKQTKLVLDEAPGKGEGSVSPIPSPLDRAKGTAEAVSGDLKSKFTPASVSEQSKEAAGILREYKATTANDRTIETLQNQKYQSAFASLSTDKQLEYTSNYEKNGDFGEEANAMLKSKGIDPTAYAAYYKASTDAAHKILQDVYGLDGYVNNYVRHAFTFTDKNEAAKFVDGFTKTLQTYSTSPLKNREISGTITDAMDYMAENGIHATPVETNPEILRQWTETNARAAQAFSFAKNELSSNNLMRFLKPGAALLPNESYIDDKWANVMFKGEQGLTLGGRWVAPKEVATLINNAVSDGLLDSSPTLRLLSGLNNHLNQMQLGLSAFHVATTTVNSAASEMGLGLQELLTTDGGFNLGMRASGLGRILKSATIIEPVIEDYIRGNAAIDTIKGPQSDAADFLMDKVNQAGGRINIENRYRTRSTDQFTQAIHDKDFVGAAVHAVPAMLEKLSSPIMNDLVPKVKLGRFLTEGDSAIARATDNYTTQLSDNETRQILGGVWDKIDNIHGQMVQDNLFWKNSQKDVANMAFRSFGWSYGTLRAIGSAGKDSVGLLGRVKAGGEALTPAMGIAIAYPLISAEIGAVVNYFNTGKAPTSYKDYYFPQSGQTKPDGTPIRLSTPGYMKDLFSYWRSPVQTLLNKASPEIQAVQEILQNKDYYGVMLRNPNDPIGTQAEQVGKYLLTNMIPFSVQSVAQVQQQSGQLSGKDVMESFFGFQKASAVIDNSDVANKISSAYDQQMGQRTLTPEQSDVQSAKSAAKTAFRSGDSSGMQKLLKTGVYTARGMKSEETKLRKQKAKGETTSETLFQGLASDTQVQLYNGMSASDKKAYYQYLDKAAKQQVSQSQ